MLQLQNGQVFQGKRFGANVDIVGGEVCFTTAMVGFNQTLTDPSYAGQIVIFAYPMIGNHKIGNYDETDDYGIPLHFESHKIHAKAVIVSEYCLSSEYEEKNLDAWLKEEGIPGLFNVDVRSLVEIIREQGCMYGVITDQVLHTLSQRAQLHEKINWVNEVSTNVTRFYFTNVKKPSLGNILVIDCGVKNGIIRELLHLGYDVSVERFDRKYDEQYDSWFCGILISNGPGSPEMLLDTTVKQLEIILKHNENNYYSNCKVVPIMGICLGHQLLALASNGQTFKMKFGNRGLNHPCIDLRTSKCYTTSQNHGYEVDMKSLDSKWKPLFVNVNDNSNEGMIHEYLPMFSVQFHPEGCPGPTDTRFLFDEFAQLIAHPECHVLKLSSWQQPNRDIRKVLLISNGALQVAQAGEFDYSGSQAIKALTEEGIEVVLINPNIASVQSSQTPHTYYYPITPEFVSKVIELEHPDGILLQFGGQTALNCGIALQDYLKSQNVRVLGTSIDTIIKTENRKLFAKCMQEINELTIESESVNNIQDGLQVASKIGYPVLVRAGFCLGGLGSGFASNDEELKMLMEHLSDYVIIDKSLKGYKEIEYEVMRDVNGNVIVVCNMENFDPVGIHTGDSIVVSPSQTITNQEYFAMRQTAVNVIQYLKVIGECNIQFALNPKDSKYYIIEVNARLSRSSALASKATGYPLAYIAAKLALGKSLTDLPNNMTRTTSACFEPSMDYIVVKMPHWDFSKFSQTSRELGTAMKSIGEVMAIGRNFEEAFQKAMRMKNIKFDEVVEWGKIGTDLRVSALLTSLRTKSKTLNEIHNETYINHWFLHKLQHLIDLEFELKEDLDCLNNLQIFKQNGFSNDYIAQILDFTKDEVEYYLDVTVPRSYPIDTCSGEFIAQSNYLYLSYWGNNSFEVKIQENLPEKDSVLVLGSSTYRVGSSCEFDWCAVHALRTLRSKGFKSVMINHNPETVSTDYDECDVLYFEELSIETIRIIYEMEKISKGIVVSVGGQVPNCLANDLVEYGLNILGTSANSINIAEDRQLFSETMDDLCISQPKWSALIDKSLAMEFALKIGYPVLVRPSYVLSGASMNVAFNAEQLNQYLDTASSVNSEHPVVISKFIENAKEIEYDAVAQNGKVINYAISEHIENAGTHSGDASLMLPAQKMYLATMRQIRNVSAQIAQELQITGCFNIQFLCKNNHIMVIECNLRASRSFPFVSKCLGTNFIELAMLAMLDIPVQSQKLEMLNYEHVCVKVPHFSFGRLAGVDPVCGVEMVSTGEIGVFAKNGFEAFLLALLCKNFKIPQKNIFISVGNLKQKLEFCESAKMLQDLGYTLYGTEGTSQLLQEHKIEITSIPKIHQDSEKNAVQMIRQCKFDLVINIPLNNKQVDITDGYLIRRSCIDNNISLLTNLQEAQLLVEAMNYMNIISNTKNIANLFHLQKSSEFLANKAIH